jgi:predicted thioesterase
MESNISETKLVHGKTACVSVTVNESNTAQAMQSGSLPVFATPSMVALMERAACECLADCLNDGQTSVGSAISVEHVAASPLESEITATAKIESVSGRKIEFVVSANDKSGEIGSGRHTRVIVDTERFMKKTESRLLNN